MGAHTHPDLDGGTRVHKTRFCTEHAAAAGDPLAGTGAHQARMVLIQWPKAKWRYSLRQAEGMGDHLADAIEGVFKAGWRVNLIDRKDPAEEGLRVFLFPEALSFTVAPEDLPEFLDLLPIGLDAVHHFNPAPVTAPLILCCTHGKHDRCCAKWGFGVYKAIAAEAEARGGFDIWECTHLGGCRLSASVISLPSRRKYGRLLPRDAPAFLQAEADGRPHLPNYRGAADLDQVAQVAEVAALHHADALGVHAPAEIAQIAATDTHRDFTARVGPVSVHLRCTPFQVQAYGACSDLEAQKPLKPKTVWRAEVLREDHRPDAPMP